MTNSVPNASPDHKGDEVFQVTLSAAVREHLYAEAHRLDVPVDQVIRSILQRALPSDTSPPRRSKSQPSPSPSPGVDTNRADEKRTSEGRAAADPGIEARKTQKPHNETRQRGSHQEERPQDGRQRDESHQEERQQAEAERDGLHAVPHPEDLLPRDFDPHANEEDEETPSAGASEAEPASGQAASAGSSAPSKADAAEDATVMDMLTSARGRLDALAEQEDTLETGRMRRVTQRLKIVHARSDAPALLSPVRPPTSARVQRALRRPNLTPPGVAPEAESSTDDAPTSMFEVLEDDPPA